VVFYGSDDNIAENNIVEGADAGITEWGERNRFFGNIALQSKNSIMAVHHPRLEWVSKNSCHSNNVGIEAEATGLFVRTALDLIVENFMSIGGTRSGGVIIDNICDNRNINVGTLCSAPGHTHTPSITLRNILSIR
jgi:hypothetical protein